MPMSNDDYFAPTHTWGLISLDWSVARGVWFKNGRNKSNCEAVSTEGCRRMKTSGRASKCFSFGQERGRRDPAAGRGQEGETREENGWKICKDRVRGEVLKQGALRTEELFEAYWNAEKRDPRTAVKTWAKDMNDMRKDLGESLDKTPQEVIPDPLRGLMMLKKVGLKKERCRDLHARTPSQNWNPKEIETQLNKTFFCF